MPKSIIESGGAREPRILRIAIVFILIWATCAMSAWVHEGVQAARLDRALAAYEAVRSEAVEVIAESENAPLARLGLM